MSPTNALPMVVSTPLAFQNSVQSEPTMYLYLLGGLCIFLVTLVVVAKSLYRAPKGGVVKVTWKDRHSLPSLLSRIPLILLGAVLKKEGTFYPGLKDFPETHIEVGSSEYVSKMRFFGFVCPFIFNSVFLTFHVRPY